MDYKDTLNLPNTDFPMKASLSQNEPKLLDFWGKIKLFEKISQKEATRGKYTLHDGPPYANGNIHIGHALNKILKDIIVKSKTMAGFRSYYIPGWDCHGLPIEHQVDKSLGKDKAGFDKYKKRKLCRDYAQKYIDIQRDEFKRLGVFGDWNNPYLTMNYEYEAEIVRQLGQIINKGLAYRGCKPVHWCTSCTTALAEAEVEYQERKSPSIYIKFELDKEAVDALGLGGEQVFAVIWTTTPWTLPANLAVALHPDFEYVAVKTGLGNFIVAQGLLENFVKKLNLEEYTILKSFKAQVLEGFNCVHPFLSRKSRLILAPYVTLEQGTGLVHTAPGHGQEDYLSGLKYGLDIYNPVDASGKFIADLPLFGGMFIFEANPLIIEHCQKIGALLYHEPLTHSYPHCWRCKQPLIFRATEQWFISMEAADLRKRALSEIEKVKWIPSWGRDRIYNMIANRPDWCISRQRTWGVPITAFYCEKCRALLTDAKIIEHVADMVAKEGSDVWFDKSASQLLPSGTKCPKCAHDGFVKEMDILDVWFDSGVSHAAVLNNDKILNNPADLYLEGSDQHRGWFHSSLLVGVANQGRAPYKSVLTHGFVVDSKGKKMSKSMGNVIAPQKIIEQNGAEILRLWVAGEDYRDDVRISQEIITRLTEGYRRIRNTCRFLLGNTSDFNPSTDSVSYENMLEIDRWIMHELQILIARVNKAYDDFEFHVIYHSLHNFCTVTLSAVYLDILKDRLYCSKTASRERRSAQTALMEILTAMTRLMAPILTFTAEEVWQCIPKGIVSEESVHLASLPKVDDKYINKELADKWALYLACRTAAYKALEIARNQKAIGSFLETKLTLHVGADLLDKLSANEGLLAEVLMVSSVKIKGMESFQSDKYQAVWEGDQTNLGQVKAGVEKSVDQKCERCWNFYSTVGKNSAYPTLCARCAEVIQN